MTRPIDRAPVEYARRAREAGEASSFRSIDLDKVYPLSDQRRPWYRQWENRVEAAEHGSPLAWLLAWETVESRLAAGAEAFVMNLKLRGEAGVDFQDWRDCHNPDCGKAFQPDVETRYHCCELCAAACLERRTPERPMTDPEEAARLAETRLAEIRERLRVGCSCVGAVASLCDSCNEMPDDVAYLLDLLTRQGAGEAPGAEPESVEMAVGAASKAWNKAVKYANETPALLSFLYDLDLMPEQVAPKTHASWRMYVAIQAWMVATTLRAEGDP